LPVATEAQLDSALAARVNFLHTIGAGLFDARMAVYGTAFVKAMPTRAPQVLFKAKQQIAGWESYAPEFSKDPMPEDALYLILDDLLSFASSENLFAACALAIMFDGYFRPSEILSVVPQHVFSVSGSPCLVAVTLSPQGAVDPATNYPARTKAKEWDDTVVLGDAASQRAGRAWVASLVKLLAAKRRVRARLLPLSLPRLEQAMAASCSRLRLTQLRLTPHTARHGGPSADYLASLRTLVQIQKRGRMNAFSTVKRYEKSAKVLRQRAKISEPLLCRAKALRAVVPQALLQAVRALQ